MIIDRVKLRLGDVEGQDELIIEIINTVQTRMSILYFDGGDVPEQLEYVVAELSVIRYNRIASEGMTAQTIEGESLSFTDDDFAPYRKDILAYLNICGDKRGRLRFL